VCFCGADGLDRLSAARLRRVQRGELVLVRVRVRVQSPVVPVAVAM
jgi:hypothetical protein